MERRVCLQLIGLGALVMTAGAQPPMPPPRPPEFATKGPTRISSGRPLSEAVELLLHLYAKVVTYEEPVLTWSGDLQPHNRLDPALKWAVEATAQTFTMPAETGTERNLALVVERTLQAYHQQTTGTRFQVLTSALGYHIVPIQVHDDRGQLVPASSPSGHAGQRPI